jgi:hypothetical protein
MPLTRQGQPPESAAKASPRNGDYPGLTCGKTIPRPRIWGTIPQCGRIKLMGVLARFLGFIWKRWADYQSVVALLDVLDFKTAVVGGLAFVGMTFFGATNMDWSAPAVVLAALGAGALVSFIMVAVRLFWRLEPAKATKETSASDSAGVNDFASDIPDVKIADDPVAWKLFETVRERDKLIPLLEAGKLHAWGRLGNGNPPPTKIPADQWSNHYLDNRPADSPGRINQTYFRPKSRPHESTYYDVHLNRVQLERAWPDLWRRTSIDRIPCTELLKMAADAGWDFTSHDSLHLLDLQNAIRQGARDNHLTVWGKLNRWSSEELLRNEVLETIPPEHWHAFYVHLWPAREGDNFNVKSWTPSQQPQNFLDLHVSRSEAATWLDRDAAAFKGKTKPNQRGML